MDWYPEFSPDYSMSNIDSIIREIEKTIIESNGDFFIIESYDHDKYFRLYLKEDLFLSSATVKFLTDWTSYTFKDILNKYKDSLKTSAMIMEIKMDFQIYFRNMIANNNIYKDLYKFYFEQGIPSD